MEVYIFKNGQKEGPYSVEDLNCRFDSGRLTAADLYWYQGCEGWQPLAQFPGFAGPKSLTQQPEPPVLKQTFSPPSPISAAPALSRSKFGCPICEGLNGHFEWCCAGWKNSATKPPPTTYGLKVINPRCTICGNPFYGAHCTTCRTASPYGSDGAYGTGVSILPFGSAVAAILGFAIEPLIHERLDQIPWSPTLLWYLVAGVLGTAISKARGWTTERLILDWGLILFFFSGVWAVKQDLYASATVLWWMACALTGAIVGYRKGRVSVGFFWGLLLGPVGVIVVLCLSSQWTTANQSARLRA